jgi:integrase
MTSRANSESNTSNGRSGKKPRTPSDRVKITDIFVKSSKSTKVRRNIKDEECRGLTLRISASGKKTFAFMGRDCGGHPRTITLGQYPDITVKRARDLAYEARRKLRDPEQLKKLLSPDLVAVQCTLLDLLNEAETHFGGKGTKIWKPRGKRNASSTARQVIKCVFGEIFDQNVGTITAVKVSKLAHSYKPKSGKETANGQASRALSYLKTVFDWASQRGKRFAKLGAGREINLNLADLSIVQDPALDDHKILGVRDRVLLPEELASILQLLIIGETGSEGYLDVDLRPIALRFILLTMCRRCEVEDATWDQFDFRHKTWTRKVKSMGREFIVTHPLSEAAVKLLKSLPTFSKKDKGTYVFANRNGGKLDNWDRACNKIKEASNTSDWHRHDLRRTVSTILSKFGVSDGESWSRKFGPVVKVDRIMKATIQNEETKEPFT